MSPNICENPELTNWFLLSFFKIKKWCRIYVAYFTQTFEKLECSRTVSY